MRKPIALAAVALAGCLALAGGLALAGCSASAAPRAAAADKADKYGSLPGFLPADTTSPDSTLTGSADNPAVTSQGDSIRVKSANGSALATVAGPEVPGEGLPFQTAATTCTWTITIRATRAPVAISAGEFSTIDHLGAVYHPTWVPRQPRPPAVVKPGQTATFELRTVMETGEGLMRWAPDGKHIVGSWDFEVEND